MGRIYIEGRNLIDNGDGQVNDGRFQHLYLVYEDESGNEYVIRGGPENPLLSIFGPGDIVIQRGILLSSSSDARNGDTAEQRGQFEFDLGARAAEDVWSVMLQQADQIDFSNFIMN